MLRQALFLLLLSACAVGPGAAPSRPEGRMLASGDTRAYWQARTDRGDPLAGLALRMQDPARRGQPLPAIAANALAGHRPVDPAVLGLALARAHHAALLADTGGVSYRLSAAQIAAYHFAVFARFGLPRTAFGGAQLTGTLTEARLTAPLWCPACDRAP